MKEKLNDFILTRDELPILLNVLYAGDNWRFDIYPFLIKKNVFSVDLDDSVVVKRLVNSNQYSERLPENSFPDIIPKYNILRNILIGSGFLKMTNWDDLLNELDKIKAVDPLKGDRFTFVGMDTNCYINRIYSVLENTYKSDISRFFFVLSLIVSKELRAARNIPKGQLEELKETEVYRKDREIFSNFWNNDSLYTRIRHIGRVEFNKQKKKSRCLMNDNLEILKDVDSDLQIIDDFRNQITKHNYNLLVVSSDKHVHDQGRGPGIVCLDLRVPFMENLPEKFSGNWDNLYDLLYLCGVYFGAIKVQGNQNSVHIYGIWRGKTRGDWDTESLKIHIGDGPIRNLLEQQLSIIRS